MDHFVRFAADVIRLRDYAEIVDDRVSGIEGFLDI
jgi:hypothetical protein